MSTQVAVIIPADQQLQLFTQADRQALNQLADVQWHCNDQKLDVDAAAAFIADAEIAVGSWGTVHPGREHLIEQCPKLKLWIHAAGSVRYMFADLPAGRDLQIASCAPAIAYTVAEMTVGYLIVGLKRALENAAANRNGTAKKPANSMTLAQASIGIVGASNVGRQVIQLLQPFSPGQILLYDPYVSAQQAQAMGAEKIDDLTELCRSANALSLHTPALPSCENIIGQAQLQALADDAVFINTSRGKCVDEPALIRELTAGRLTAFLDVSNPEPAPDDSPLRTLANVHYTSHIAGGPSPRIGRQVLEDIRAYLNGEQLQMLVTPDMLDRIA